MIRQSFEALIHRVLFIKMAKKVKKKTKRILVGGRKSSNKSKKNKIKKLLAWLRANKRKKPKKTKNKKKSKR